MVLTLGGANIDAEPASDHHPGIHAVDEASISLAPDVLPKYQKQLVNHFFVSTKITHIPLNYILAKYHQQKAVPVQLMRNSVCLRK